VKIKNKCSIFIMALVALTAFYSCLNERKNASNNNEVEKKKTFIKMVNFLKERNIDSLKPYFLTDSLSQTELVYHIIDECSYILSHSDATITLDSIKIRDTLMVQSVGLPIYKYYLRFYRDTAYVGTIEMLFFSNVNDSARNLFAERKLDFQIDTTGLLEEINTN
jgi:hypothetical protein